MSSIQPLLTVNDVAALFGIHHKKAQRLARTGVLPCVKIGAVYRFRAEELEAWVSSQARSAVNRGALPTSVRMTQRGRPAASRG
jgi:excisionase family DNA binding protein